MIRVVVVSDIRLYRDGVASQFDASPRYHLVGTAASPEAARRCVQESLPDVVVVDMTMADSLSLVRELGPALLLRHESLR